MQKIKLATGLISVITLLAAAGPVMAANISITQLPSYISTNGFKLSYSCLGCTSVQFYVSKNDGAFNAFGPAMTSASGQVSVSDLQVNDQTKYTFKVVDAGIGEASTTTIYDVSGPSPVSGYYKEEPTSSTYKLHWRNPDNEDFAKVIIYRGETADFSADGSHEVATVLGSPNSDMTYDQSVPLADKEYFYAIRAIDKAGNTSGLVGDAGIVLGTSIQKTSAPQASSNVVNLPKEETQGEVLPASTESPEDEVAEEGVINNVVELAKNKTKITAIILAGIAFVGYLLYRKGHKS